MTRQRPVLAWAVVSLVSLSEAAYLLMPGARSGSSRPEPPLVSAGVAAQAPAGGEGHAPGVPATMAATPVRLQIPGIGVDSRLLSLGQSADGSMQVPAPGPSYDQAGWYRYSPTPGSRGPAVIVGHVDSARTGRSVFSRLAELHVGSQVLVTGSDRTTIAFTVTRLLRVAKATFPTQLVYGDTRDAELRLITCGGRLDTHSGHYEDNVIVMATRTAAHRV